MKYRLIADSSSNLFEMEGIDYGYAPVKLVSGEKTYVEDERLNIEKMVEELKEYQGASRTACPNTEDWLNAFGDADVILGATVTGTLSGTYNSAMLAKREYEELHPGAKVYIHDSLSIGPEVELLLEHARDGIREGKEFEELVEEMKAYSKKTHLLFSLEKLDNLVKNGRVNKIVAAAAGVLNIRIVGKASDGGELEPLHKCRGEKKAYMKVYQEMKNHGYSGGKVIICHAFNEAAAEKIKEMIFAEYPQANVKIRKSGAICTFYAEEKGIIVGFEGNLC